MIIAGKQHLLGRNLFESTSTNGERLLNLLSNSKSQTIPRTAYAIATMYEYMCCRTPGGR